MCRGAGRKKKRGAEKQGGKRRGWVGGKRTVGRGTREKKSEKVLLELQTGKKHSGKMGAM